MRELERFIVLQVVDLRWREHLENMEALREGIGLRQMAQKDPLVEYTGEGEQMFTELGRVIRGEVVLHLFHAELAPEDGQQQLAQQPGSNGGGNSANLHYEHQTAAGAEVIDAALTGGVNTAGVGAVAAAPQTVHASPQEKLGRNDACWCGSGKKFKKCHGA
jgi:preprotein translocase subunit SecA